MAKTTFNFHNFIIERVLEYFNGSHDVFLSTTAHTAHTTVSTVDGKRQFNCVWMFSKKGGQKEERICSENENRWRVSWDLEF